MTGAKMIAEERSRQIDEWSAEHDDDHDRGELVDAAIALLRGAPPAFGPSWIGDLEWKLRQRKDRKRTLAVAGAFVAAEIDRLMRSES